MLDLAEFDKLFGEGALRPASTLKAREYRGSGSIALDVALGGGYGKGTVVDTIGRQSAGKTLAFEMAAVTAQRVENAPSVLFDFEGTFDPRRFKMLGGDPDRLALVRAENFGDKIEGMFLEWCTDMLKVMLHKKMFACIGMDSTAAMTTYAEYKIKEEKGEEKQTVAYTARGIASLLRLCIGSGLLQRSDSTLFFISQMRDNIGGRGFKGQPPADKRTGGRALPFFAATQLEISRGDLFKADVQQESGYIEKDVEVGHETKVRVRKNKNNAKQGRVATFDLYSEGEVIGIDRTEELAKLAVLTGVVEKIGTYYNIDGNRVAHGKDDLTSYLRSNSEIAAGVEIRTRQSLDVQQTAQALPSEVIYGVGDDFDPDDDIIGRLSAQEAINAQT